MSLDTAIKSRFDGNATLRSLIGNRAYHVMAPQESQYPLLIWSLVSEEPVHAMGSDAGYREARVQVSSFAKDADKVVAVSEAARAALSRFRGTAGGTVIQDILADTAFDQLMPEVEEGIFHRSNDFRVFYQP